MNDPIICVLHIHVYFEFNRNEIIKKSLFCSSSTCILYTPFLFANIALTFFEKHALSCQDVSSTAKIVNNINICSFQVAYLSWINKPVCITFTVVFKVKTSIAQINIKTDLLNASVLQLNNTSLKYILVKFVLIS